jgi:hypothetical protein
LHVPRVSFVDLSSSSSLCASYCAALSLTPSFFSVVSSPAFVLQLSGRKAWRLYSSPVPLPFRHEKQKITVRDSGVPAAQVLHLACLRWSCLSSFWVFPLAHASAWPTSVPPERARSRSLHRFSRDGRVCPFDVWC